MENSEEIDWCDIIIHGNLTNETKPSTKPFCERVETYTFPSSDIRVIDVLVLLSNVLFLVFLAVKFVPTVKKLTKAWTLFSVLYCLILVIPILCCTHEVVSMIWKHHVPAARITHYMLRGAILTVEISVVVFGLTFKSYHGQRLKLVITTSAIIMFSLAYTILEGTVDSFWRKEIVCEKHLFTHGGMIFLFTTSTLLSLAYLITYLMYLFNLHIRWDLPTKKSFYRYALFLSVVNIVQAIGSMFWFNGKEHKHLGNAGICLTMVTTEIYLVTFAPVVYWIFLRNYYRMNNIVESVSPTSNVNSDTISPYTKWWKVSLKGSTSKPLPIYKQILQDESTSLLGNGDSPDSSVNGSNINSYLSAELLSTS